MLSLEHDSLPFSAVSWGSAMKRLVAIALFLISLPLHAQQVDVHGARIWPSPDYTRLALDVGDAVTHKILRLENPHRLVIDIPDARLSSKLPIVQPGDPIVTGLRHGIQNGNDLRIVVDLKQAVRPKSFLLKPNERYGHRLVVDLAPRDAAAPVAVAKGPPPPSEHLSVRSRSEAKRDLVIAIDAGHGGDDPGATGVRGTKEKTITLAIARELAALVNKEPGMTPLLIRNSDYFVSLRGRISKARKNKADLFISIHADAFNDPRVKGSSVYTLSNRGASSEAAKWLATKENNADLIGGVSITEDRGSQLSKVLLEMQQNGSIEHSRLAASSILNNLKRLGSVHNSKVQRAGFVVLKAPDIPSVLVETAFISNPSEEGRLRSSRYQRGIAKAILNGIKSYFRQHPVPGTRLSKLQGAGVTSSAVKPASSSGPDAKRQHRIVDGDTLGEIAEQYAVSLAALRDANGIRDDRIRVGQVLTIPEG